MNRVALVIIDVQNEFLTESGMFYSGRMRSVIPHIRRLLDEARKVGAPVIFTQDTQYKGRPSYDTLKHGDHCLKGTKAWEIVDELKPKDGEYVVEKREYSGFYQTDLEEILRNLKVKALLFTGVTSGCCVQATVHDAFFRGYEIFIVRECVSAPTEMEHEAGLSDLERYFGRIVDVEEAIRLVRMQQS